MLIQTHGDGGEDETEEEEEIQRRSSACYQHPPCLASVGLVSPGVDASNRRLPRLYTPCGVVDVQEADGRRMVLHVAAQVELDTKAESS